MRVVKEIPHPECKITIFDWNNKYLLKLERGPIEQTYKVNALDITGENELENMLNPEFIQKVVQRFDAMEDDLVKAMEQA